MNPLKIHLYDTALFGIYRQLRQDRELGRWARQGRPSPPPHLIKESVVLEYARRHDLRTLVETGTHLGEMIRAGLPHFDRIYSIELDERLYDLASLRFRAQPKVTILRGDSGMLLPSILTTLTEPALFWLDGHFSGAGTARGTLETPLRAELDAIYAQPLRHVVLVDDARCLGTGDYPMLDDLRRQAAAAGRRIDVADDVVRICADLP